jgi:hypothetical protein
LEDNIECTTIQILDASGVRMNMILKYFSGLTWTMQGSFIEVHLAESTSIWNEENAEVPGSEKREVKKVLSEDLGF